MKKELEGSAGQSAIETSEITLPIYGQSLRKELVGTAKDYIALAVRGGFYVAEMTVVVYGLQQLGVLSAPSYMVGLVLMMVTLAVGEGTATTGELGVLSSNRFLY